MERPLHPLLRDRNKLLALARALLYSPQTAEAHERVLCGAFETEPSAKRVRRLAERTLRWTSSRPQPRLNEVVRALQADALLQRIVERHALRPLPLVASPAAMRALPGAEQVKVLDTVLALADWLRLDPEHLPWFADLKDRNRKGSRACPGVSWRGSRRSSQTVCSMDRGRRTGRGTRTFGVTLKGKCHSLRWLAGRVC